MTPRPRAQRYNAHGDRWCTGCERYLRLDHFAPRPGRADPWYGRCRDCINAQCRRNYRKRVLWMSEAEWRAQVEADMARQRRTRAQRAAVEVEPAPGYVIDLMPTPPPLDQFPGETMEEKWRNRRDALRKGA